MVTAWIEAVSGVVIALTALGAVLAWIWRTRKLFADWRKRKRGSEILGVVVPGMRRDAGRCDRGARQGGRRVTCYERGATS